jgi:tetratricopeptide (TPR) repeat protein
MANLAECRRVIGRLDLALPLYEQTLTLRKAKLGPDHLDTVITMSNLAECYREAGKLDLALSLHEQTMALIKAKYGPDHMDTLASMNNLAQCYREAGKLDVALPLYEQTLALQKAKLGLDRPETLITMNNLAECYREAGKLDLALSLHEQTMALRKAKLGPDHSDTLISMNNLAAVYWSLEKYDRLVPLFEEVVKLRVAKSGENDPYTVLAKANLGVSYKLVGRLAEAIPLLERAADAGRNIASLRWVKGELSDAYLRAGRTDKLAGLIKEQVAEARGTLLAGSPQLAGTLAQAGSTLIGMKAWTDAEPILRECLVIRQAKEPDAWTTFNARSLLGAALTGQARFDEAEPMILAGFEGITKRAGAIPPTVKFRITEAAERVVWLYEAWGKHDDAARWRVKLGVKPVEAMPADPFAR